MQSYLTTVNSAEFELRPSSKDMEGKNKEFFFKNHEEEEWENDDMNKIEIIVNGKKHFLDFKSLRKSLNKLRSSSQKNVAELKGKERDHFDNVIEALGTLRPNKKAYQKIIAEINKIFSNIEKVFPGTVAAYFVGCYSSTNFPGPNECSSTCLSAILDKTDRHCKENVLIYQAGSFSSLNPEIQSKHVYIQVSENFDKFTSENIEQLRNSGIEEATVYRSTMDGNYEVLMDKQPLQRMIMPINGNSPSYSPIAPFPVLSPLNSGDVTWNGWLFLLLLFIVIIIIVFAFYAARNKDKLRNYM